MNQFFMHTITLSQREHKGEERIFVEFFYDKKINDAIRQIAGIKWSQTYKQWHLPSEKNSVNALRQKIDSLATLDISTLKKQLEEKKTKKENNAVIKSISLLPKEVATQNASAKAISTINMHVLPLMEEHLKLKAYSFSTRRTYLNEMRQLLQMLSNIPADELKPAHLKRYLVFCFEKLQLKENTLHSRINALKFYYEQVLKREKFFWEIPRPKKPIILPKLLNETELAKLFNALTNKKHKAILFTVYSAGLRVSEVVNLKLADIDSKRMQIFVQRAKGKKDRYVNLSPLLLDILRGYIKQSKPKPKAWLFESEQTGIAYPARTVQQIFTNAKHRAGIKKQVGIHSLRHSFATHLLDKGTDIRYIKDLLGHFNIKTTERYLHVSRKQLVNITSPLDDLWRKESIDW